LTFTTDFGRVDGYVGAMYGVALSIAPEARLLDISHHVPPHDVRAGAAVLASACPYFPTGTVHVAVVDPGVGTTRRPLGLRAGRHTFVGPDNGLLVPVARALGGVEAVVVLNRAAFHRTPVSRTFHGRDVFTPCAAWLCAGRTLADLGDPVDPASLVTLAIPEPRRDGARWRGEVVRVDHFGNLVTNLDLRHAPAPEAHRGGTLRIADRVVPRAVSYGEVTRGAPVAVVGADGAWEVAVNGGSAAAWLGGVPLGVAVAVDDVDPHDGAEPGPP
jgi:hypothetical protein